MVKMLFAFIIHLNVPMFSSNLEISRCSQVDFDDGHCPTWQNQLIGHNNIKRAAQNTLNGVPMINQAPLLMVRPRAWNMLESNFQLLGEAIPGPLFDVGILLYHSGRILLDNDSGPYLYLPKLENGKEAGVWNKILTWIEQQLDLPVNCTKVCVLIENVLAAFEMEEILFELRHRAIGLNCGLLDYSASILKTFGKRSDFVLPDRDQSLSMDKPFLKNYRDLLIKTCHKRGALATDGMAAHLLPVVENGRYGYQETLEKVKSMKSVALTAGVDGFLVFDLGLVEPMHKLFTNMSIESNQLHISRGEVTVKPNDLLQMPKGSVTETGLEHNIRVGLLFIEAWLRGQGCFFVNGVVEDSATAEISTMQVWQWLLHQSTLEHGGTVTIAMVRDLTDKVVEELSEMKSSLKHGYDKDNLTIAANIFMDIVTKEDSNEFITDYLYNIISAMS